MIFTSFQYAGFLVLVVGLNWLLPVRFRPPLLLAASFVFYAAWSAPALVILVVACLVAWSAGLAIPRFEGRARLVLTVAAVAIAASSLVVFKIAEAAGLDKSGVGLAARIVVPVGLSFFSFQAVSYLIDVYRREIEPSRSLIDVSLYLSFFPHLLAGPIVRAKKLIPAFHGTPRRPNSDQWHEATELVLVGVFKKVALADPIFALAVTGFRQPGQIGTLYTLLLLVGILVGAYFDITGYIDIARGSAKFLGIDMQRNSLLPLTKSTGYADFWRRWQLTVMMWFRDYVYRPVRGDGSVPFRENAALFATFFVLGIWHGFTVGWLLWGVLSGVIIVVERSLQTRRAARRRAQTKAARRARSKAMMPKPPSKVLGLAIPIVLVMVTFPLVAAESLAASFELYRALGRIHGSMPSGDLVWMTAISLGALPLLDRREQRREATAGGPDPMNVTRAAAFGLMVLGIVLFSGPTPQSFLYFNF